MIVPHTKPLPGLPALLSESVAGIDHGSRPLDVSEVSTHDEFNELRDAWNNIAREARPRSVFLQHEWFAAAWAWRQLDARLHTLVARRNDRMVGALPLMCRTAPLSRPLEFELLTIPDTQLADLLCAPTDADDVASAFASTLAGDDRWDTLRFDYLSPEGPCVNSLVRALRSRGLEVVERDCGRNFFVTLSGTWADYCGSRSRRWKKAMHLAANRLRRSGDVQVQWLRPGKDDKDVWHAALETVIAISARSWKRETGNSLDRAGPQAFVRSLSGDAVDRGWLSIWLLTLGEKPLAAEYGLVFDGNVHALRSDFDSACVKTSPGTHLSGHVLEHLFDRSFVRYYMGRGENAYKLRWADDAVSLRQVIAYNRTPGGRLEWLREEFVKPALRRTRDALWGNDNAISGNARRKGAKTR